jgi:hypothetical protein
VTNRSRRPSRVIDASPERKQASAGREQDKKHHRRPGPVITNRCCRLTSFQPEEVKPQNNSFSCKAHQTNSMSTDSFMFGVCLNREFGMRPTRTDSALCLRSFVHCGDPRLPRAPGHCEFGVKMEGLALTRRGAEGAGVKIGRLGSDHTPHRQPKLAMSGSRAIALDKRHFTTCFGAWAS